MQAITQIKIPEKKFNEIISCHFEYKFDELIDTLKKIISFSNGISSELIEVKKNFQNFKESVSIDQLKTEIDSKFNQQTLSIQSLSNKLMQHDVLISDYFGLNDNSTNESSQKNPLKKSVEDLLKNRTEVEFQLSNNKLKIESLNELIQNEQNSRKNENEDLKNQFEASTKNLGQNLESSLANFETTISKSLDGLKSNSTIKLVELYKSIKIIEERIKYIHIDPTFEKNQGEIQFEENERTKKIEKILAEVKKKVDQMEVNNNLKKIESADLVKKLGDGDTRSRHLHRAILHVARSVSEKFKIHFNLDYLESPLFTSPDPLNIKQVISPKSQEIKRLIPEDKPSPSDLIRISSTDRAPLKNMNYEDALNCIESNLREKADRKKVEEYKLDLSDNLENMNANVLGLTRRIEEIELSNLRSASDDGIKKEQKRLQEEIMKLNLLFSKIDEIQLMFDAKLDTKANNDDLGMYKANLKNFTTKVEKLYKVLNCEVSKEGGSPSVFNFRIPSSELEKRVADLEDKLKVGEDYYNLIDNVEEKDVNEKGNHDVLNTPNSPRKHDIGIKQVLVRQENKINQALFKIEEFQANFGENSFADVYKSIRDQTKLQLEESEKMFKKLIEDVNHKILFKVDNDKLENIQLSLSDNFLKELEKKIDRSQLLKTHTLFRKKFDKLEDKININLSGNISSNKNESTLPLFLLNEKCFFCNQNIKLKHDLVHNEILSSSDYAKIKDSDKRTKNIQMHKTSYNIGKGFSRVLNAIKDEKELEDLMQAAKSTSNRLSEKNELIKSFSQPDLVEKKQNQNQNQNQKVHTKLKKNKNIILSNSYYPTKVSNIIKYNSHK